eukprot:16445378-Heterocapsa_arctica.AAC.1
MDSGASNSVAPIEAGPGVKVVESPGSRRGQHYISAGNKRIPNIGEQTMHFTTNEGKCSVLKWQNAQVTKPLISVSHICDAGHRSSSGPLEDILSTSKADVGQPLDAQRTSTCST